MTDSITFFWFFFDILPPWSGKSEKASLIVEIIDVYQL